MGGFGLLRSDGYGSLILTGDRGCAEAREERGRRPPRSASHKPAAAPWGSSPSVAVKSILFVMAQSGSEGRVPPVSQLRMVRAETPILSASCSRVRPARFGLVIRRLAVNSGSADGGGFKSPPVALSTR